MKTSILWAAGLLAAATCASLGQTNTENSASDTSATTNATLGRLSSFERNFLRQAGADSRLEILLGQEAQTNSQNGDIQAFGQTLVTDHTAAFDQAQALANEFGLTLRDSPTARQLQTGRAFGRLSGLQFDRRLIGQLSASHILDINRFETAALRARRPEVRAYARSQLPVLMQHLVTALEIRESLTNSVTASNSLAHGQSEASSTATSQATVTSP